ncbi:MAG: hypothetical protein V3W41_16520 [Planctomycetota bacterium]
MSDDHSEKRKGILSVFGPPESGPARALWLGLVLIVIPFALKQVMVSTSMSSLGTVLEKPRLQAARAAEFAKIERDNIAVERGRKDDRWQEIDRRYDKLFEEIRGDEQEAAAAAILKLQWFFYLKIAFDLCRLLGSLLILFGAIHIAIDPKCNTWVKAYGVACGVAVMLTMTIGSLVTLIG